MVGADDERNGTYGWFKKMEDYARFYHESRVKNIFSNGALLDSLPPSELIAIKKYYDERWSEGCHNGGGCKSQEQVDAEKISANIEKRLTEMTKNFQ